MLKSIVILWVIILFFGCAGDNRFSRREGLSRLPQSQSPRSSDSRPGEIRDKQPPAGKVYQEGMASYYAHDFHGKKTANGEVFDMNALTAAHRELPFNTKVLVENRENGKTVEIRINDRGPFAKNRIIDLSLGAARRIDLIGAGTARVRLRVME
ncbi:MAG: hypothetical protein A2293_15320 [Elusimicrobia bacterium RIFOXYB2_FULL_49_7]|nr:MAG: hypothetical protein A2293_15320 [Elusimicrobia bacterium RIFOXYB2_FULL_49_7]